MAVHSAHSYVPYQVVGSDNSVLRTHLLPYLRYWPWFIVSLGLALAGAYVYLKYKQPVYRIQASLLLQDEKRGNVQTNPLKELEAYSPKKVVENELEVLRSSSLMDQVVTSLHLDTKYYRETSFGKREIYMDSPVWIQVESGNPALYKKPLTLAFLENQSVRINGGQVYPLNQRLQTPYGNLRIMTRQPVTAKSLPVLVQVMPQASAVGMYLDNLKVEPTSKTSTVIRLTLEDAVPQKGEAILNSLINAYNQAAVTDKNKMAASTLQFVEKRLRMVSGELAGVEKNVEQYKSGLGITDLSTQAQSFLQTTQQNDTQLSQVNIQLAALNELQEFITNQSDKRGSTPATVGLNDAVLLGEINKLADLELKRDALTQTTSEDNPLLQTVDNQIKATRNNIGQNIKTMKAMLTSSKEEYVAKNEKLEKNIRSIPQQERALMDIARQQTIKNNLYTYLLQKREEMAVTFAASVADSRILDAATSSGSPVKPVGVVIYSLFGLLGLLLPTAAIAGKQALNTRVTRRFDVENSTQVPILGEVMNKRHRDVLVVAPHQRSVIAEQIRSIRTNLQGWASDVTPKQVMLFTSSMSGEGKSFVSLNLGASMAMMGQPTVILEMDMRMPRLHQLFGIDNSVGLSSYLNGDATLAEILKPVPGHPNYFIIPCGPLPPDPSELLGGRHVKQLIDLLRDQFRYVLLDAPPIGIVTDAQVIAPFADTTLYVIRHGVTPKHSLKLLDTLYRENRFQNLQIILNAVGGSEAYHYSDQIKNGYSYR
ncbi:polysaccharide biosynthesis tyrosine autokinase [Spirosoma sp. BT702]|uniref:Polysaccharide biosynthesis tyrosine autokinase n=1 Tax=Spirosoma profusum TaxID=2771354 RepID=A0A926XVR7_9BACT|nr:tyrosine-protein kinase [Spirosoma profusum]MBD2701422.1 polysaccharide biosynthesis tyrosine autokinase [Spirosoma profusum]